MDSRNELGIIRQLCTRLYTRGEVVRAVQHVVRRGAVYWWRRRVCQKVGETARTTIAISLRTTNLGLAWTIAAHLTHESERVMRRENVEMLSAEQTKAMLTSVARAHLAKLDRVAALEISTSGRAAVRQVSGGVSRPIPVRGRPASGFPTFEVAAHRSGRDTIWCAPPR